MNQEHIQAIEQLQRMADSAASSASASDRFAAEKWSDYRRHAVNARESWREHRDLLEAIAALERSGSTVGEA